MATILPNSFVPTSISGCTLWLNGADRSSVISSAGAVSQWNDRSSSGNNAVTITGAPTYSGSNVGFNLSNSDLMRTSASNAFSISSTTIYYVAQVQTVVGVIQDVISFPDAGTKTVRYVNGILLGTAAATGDANDYGNSNYYVNGFFNPNFSASTYVTTHQVNAVSVNMSGNSRINLSDSFMSRYFSGSISELLFYSSAPTTLQRQQLEGYLGWKWGIQGSLPASHPFRFAPPNASGSAVALSIPLTLPRNSFQTSTAPIVFLNPTTITTCSLWLDGADSGSMSLSGTSVTAWRDKSNSGNGPSSSSGSYPSYNSSINAVSWTGVANSRLIFPASFSSAVVGRAFSIFIVEQRTVGTSQFFFSGTAASANSNLLIGYSGANPLINTRFSFYANDLDYNGLTSYSTGEPATIKEYIYLSPNRSIYINGNLGISDTNATNLASWAGPALGGDVLNNVAYRGNIYEVLVYSATITTTQRQIVEGYLAWKWGLVSMLPSNHPYKNSVPAGSGISVPAIPVLQSASFRPTQISGLQMWLDGQDPNGNGIIPANGASISSWTDKSGAGNTATSGTDVTYNTTGISNLPVMSFTSVPSYFNSTDLYSNRSFSVFIVCRRQAANSVAQGLIGGTTSSTNQNMIILFNSATSIRFSFFGNDLSATIPAYTGNTATEPPLLFGFTYTPGSRNISVNGTLAASDTNSTNLTAALGERIGWWGNGVANNFSFNGFIGEILVYNAVPTTASRQNIEGYLAWKWNLVSNLPANHPFKVFPPPPN